MYDSHLICLTTVCTPLNALFCLTVAVDIKDLVTLEEVASNPGHAISPNGLTIMPSAQVMEEEGLGPNGGLMYAMDFLTSDEGFAWLEEEMKQYEDSYLLIDCPGQIELYTNGCLMRNLVDRLQQWGARVAGVYLIDRYHRCHLKTLQP